MRGIIFEKRGKKEVEWKEGKFNGNKGREALLLALDQVLRKYWSRMATFWTSMQ
jgi:hypothetical protein